MNTKLLPAPPLMQGISHNVHLDMNAADNDLRAQLAMAIAPSHQHGYPDHPQSSESPQHLHHLDASMNMANMDAGDSDGNDGPGGKGSKRELSQSKRAAQNRAAQRAFRQRKEGYIKKLEEQVRELHSLEENYKAIQTENYSLREYIIHLQSRLIESHGEYPQPPPNVNLSHPTSHTSHAAHHGGHGSSLPSMHHPQHGGNVGNNAHPHAHQVHGQQAMTADMGGMRQPEQQGMSVQGMTGTGGMDEESLEARALGQLQASKRQEMERGGDPGEFKRQMQAAGSDGLPPV